MAGHVCFVAAGVEAGGLEVEIAELAFGGVCGALGGAVEVGGAGAVSGDELC